MSVRHGIFAADGAENPRTASVQPADQHKPEISWSPKARLAALSGDSAALPTAAEHYSLGSNTAAPRQLLAFGAVCRCSPRTRRPTSSCADLQHRSGAVRYMSAPAWSRRAGSRGRARTGTCGTALRSPPEKPAGGCVADANHESDAEFRQRRMQNATGRHLWLRCNDWQADDLLASRLDGVDRHGGPFFPVQRLSAADDLDGRARHAGSQPGGHGGFLRVRHQARTWPSPRASWTTETCRQHRSPFPARHRPPFRTLAFMTGSSKAEIDAMIEEATVGCYDEEEQLTGLATMVEDNLPGSFSIPQFLGSR